MSAHARARAAAALAALAAAATVAAAPRAAAAEPPSDRRLVVVGLGLALPTYALGTVLHEGSHVVAAELVGGDTLTFRPWPGRDPLTGAFQLGLTRVRGLRTDRARFWFFMAPKVTDVVLLGGWLALHESSAYPSGAYGQLVLTVLATGLWVDFAKDTLAFSRHNDLVKSMSILGLRTEWQRLPARLVMGAASAGLGYLVWRGHRRLFALNDEPGAPPRVLPLGTWAF
ncbi:MAG: hypothetical protein KJZ91_13950 [Myxococcales bacterium]|nr:hypothetical protein [Myxococcales bacterium]